MALENNGPADEKEQLSVDWRTPLIDAINRLQASNAVRYAMVVTGLAGTIGICVDASGMTGAEATAIAAESSAVREVQIAATDDIPDLGLNLDKLYEEAKADAEQAAEAAAAAKAFRLEVDAAVNN